MVASVGVGSKVYETMGIMARWLLSTKSDSDETMSKSRHDDVAGEDDNYISWLKQHPCAISSFEEMMKSVKGKEIAIFLDYDGTLSPIVSDPDRAFMSDQMRAAVCEVAKHFPTAIISGRSREKVYGFVKLSGVYYSGSHGMDTIGPSPKNNSSYHFKSIDQQGNEVIVFQPAKDFLPAILKMLIEMKDRTKSIEGVVIEDNRFCLSVHYRHVKSDEDYERLQQDVKSVLEKYPEFHMTRGKKVLEIRPTIQWNKGHALNYLLHNLSSGLSDDDDSKNNIIPIYIGDDTTDEDAFKVVRERGQGYPILVSSKPRKTAATHSLRDPSQVLSFLIHLARWGHDNAYHFQD